jgi:hypothetical protein
MNKHDQACELAGFLAPMLRGARDTPGDPAAAQRPSPDEIVDRTQPDVDLAIRLELQDLLREEPALLRPPPGRSEPDCELVRERLRRLFSQNGGHTVNVLWALVAGVDGKPHPDVPWLIPAPKTDNRWRKLAGWMSCLRKHAWLQRKVAGLWMNLLIASVLAIAWWVAWPPPAGPSLGVAALAVFSIWCLSFVPGWMYIRFVGQRAGALWDEYVLNLHRLGWDSPGRLPRPPVTSQFYVEWFNDNGVVLSRRQNIYRQKFDAYYGKSVSESGHREGSAVRIETLFPVFLVTATLAVSWTVVLWSPDSAGNPAGVWDVLKFGFLGAYTFILQMLVRRFFQSDLRPSAYAHAMLRIIVALIVVAVLYELLPQQDLRTEAVVAFVIGFFPLVGMQALQRTAAAALRVAVPSLNQPYPLNQIDGLTIWYEARLLEVGIEDMQSLATANFVDVMLHTRVPVGRLVDWVDQAHLYLHLDRIEHGRSEQRRKARDQARHPETDRQCQVGAIVQGSASKANRAGTRTRTTLRQLGIRKATDLLKAFPAKQIDPYARLPQNSPAAAHLRAIGGQGLDTAQVRSIVRVLSKTRSLAPVWNWENRGVEPRSPTRQDIEV